MAARAISTRQIMLSSNAPGVRTRGLSEWTTTLTPGITLDPNVAWACRAVSGTAWYSAPNLVYGTSSRFAYTYLGVVYYVDLATGTYPLYDIELQVAELMSTLWGHGTPSSPVFAFGMHESTSQMFWQIQSPHLGYAFAPDVSTIEVWGMPPSEPREAENTVTPQRYTAVLASDFTLGTESYTVHCDLVTGSYLGSEMGDALFSLPLGSSQGPNTQMVFTANSATPFLPVASRQINQITCRVTSNTGADLSLRGEPVTVVLALEAIR
jgi:serine/threonine protein kinase